MLSESMLFQLDFFYPKQDIWMEFVFVQNVPLYVHYVLHICDQGLGRPLLHSLMIGQVKSYDKLEQYPF